VWRRLKRESLDVARCTVKRLMKEMELQGVVRGKPVRTTFSDKSAACPLDHVNRQFHAPAPNRLWVSDFTYVSTWAGFVYVPFVIDVYARYIVGWRVSRSAHAGFVLDALEQAIHDRQPVNKVGLIHHSDRGSQGRFKRPSQHCHPITLQGNSRGLLQASSSQGFFGAVCSLCGQRRPVPFRYGG
jgi:transposase InsO family protein